MIKFEAEPIVVNSKSLVVLPKQASAQLPSRGMVMVEGTLNGAKFQTPLEPDGKGSHWFKVRIGTGKATVSIEPSKQWPEPELPVDLKKALGSSPKIQPLWDRITPMARWDWLRWINATANSETRQKRIDVAFSKLKQGDRRPCCFNRTMCTDPSVSKSGMLLEPTAGVSV